MQTENSDGRKRRRKRSENLAAIRSRALSRLFPGTFTGAPVDASLELLPRIIGSEIAYRSRLLEEIATLQFMLLQEALRPLKDRQKASLPAIVREMRGLIRDQLRMVKEAPLGVGADSAKHQAAELLQRRAYLLAEARRRGLDRLLDQTAPQAAGATGPSAPLRNPGLEEIAALVLSLEAQGAPEKPAEPGAASEPQAEGYRDRAPE